MAEISKLDKILLPIPASTPAITDLTTAAISGTGVFDQLMRTLKLHLTEEYESQRITGKEYSNVYLGLVSSTLEQAIRFLLNEQQIALVNSEIALNRQRTVTELAQTDDTLLDGLGFNGDANVEGIVALSKVTEVTKELLLQEQIGQVGKEADLISQKIVTELGQTDNTVPLNSVAGFNINEGLTFQGLLIATTEKMTHESLLIEQKIVSEIAQTSSVLPNDLGYMLNTVLGGTLEQAIAKGTSEVGLLNQKTITELAQTADDIPTTYLNTIPTVQGVVRAQTDLFIQQTAGFIRDAEQKITKMMLDTWAVRRTTDEGLLASPAGLDDAEVKKVLAIAKDGIGAVSGTSAQSRLHFTAGANELLEDDVVIGQTSIATAIIASVTVLSGDWSTNDATGFIDFADVPVGGTFVDLENLTCNRLVPVTCAVADGVIILL